MAFDVKKAVEGKTKKDLQKLMEMGLKKHASMKEGKSMSTPGPGVGIPGQGGGGAQGKSIPAKVEGSIGRIGEIIGAKKGHYEDHINEHIREVKEYLASR